MRIAVVFFFFFGFLFFDVPASWNDDIYFPIQSSIILSLFYYYYSGGSTAIEQLTSFLLVFPYFMITFHVSLVYYSQYFSYWGNKKTTGRIPAGGFWNIRVSGFRIFIHHPFSYSLLSLCFSTLFSLRGKKKQKLPAILILL